MTNNLISRAIIYTINQDYLYGLTLTKFNYVEDDSIDTLGVALTDGKVTCRYNLDFIKSLQIDTLSKVLVHEVLHIIFQHHSRMKGRDSLLWNIASDLAVNSLIVGMEEAFPDGLYPVKFGLPNGLLAEQYYDALMDNKDSISSSDDTSGSSSSSISMDGKKIGEFSPLNSIVDEITQMTVDKDLTQIMDKCYNQGYYPGYQVEQAIKNFTYSTKVDWKTVLSKFIGWSIKKDRYSSYSKPNRRFGWGSKGHLSSYTSKIVFAIDTSASMSSETLSKVQKELGKIHKLRQVDIEVIECDAIVQHHYKFNSSKKINLSFYGRGGTSFAPVFDYVVEKNINPDALVYFTDLYGIFPKVKPRYPVLWVSETKNINVPFGKVLRIE